MINKNTRQIIAALYFARHAKTQNPFSFAKHGTVMASKEIIISDQIMENESAVFFDTKAPIKLQQQQQIYAFKTTTLISNIET